MITRDITRPITRDIVRNVINDDWLLNYSEDQKAIIRALGLTPETAFRDVAANPQTFWLDTSDSSRITKSLVGSDWRVTNYADKSGKNHNATQSTTSIAPITDASTQNGLNVFDLNNTSMNLPSAATLAIQNKDYEILWVGKSTLSTTPQFIISGTGRAFECHLNGSVGARFIPDEFGDGGQDFADIGVTDQYNGVFNVFSLRVNSNVGYIRVNGTDSGDTAANARSTLGTSMTIFRRVDGSFAITGQCGEIMIFDRVLTASERAGIESYLNTKWGI